jgi:hypothetical protein
MQEFRNFAAIGGRGGKDLTGGADPVAFRFIRAWPDPLYRCVFRQEIHDFQRNSNVNGLIVRHHILNEISDRFAETGPDSRRQDRRLEINDIQKAKQRQGFRLRRRACGVAAVSRPLQKRHPRKTFLPSAFGIDQNGVPSSGNPLEEGAGFEPIPVPPVIDIFAASMQYPDPEIVGSCFIATVRSNPIFFEQTGADEAWRPALAEDAKAGLWPASNHFLHVIDHFLHLQTGKTM